MPFLSESWFVVVVVLLLTAATLALVVVAGRLNLSKGAIRMVFDNSLKPLLGELYLLF